MVAHTAVIELVSIVTRIIFVIICIISSIRRDGRRDTNRLGPISMREVQKLSFKNINLLPERRFQADERKYEDKSDADIDDYIILMSRPSVLCSRTMTNLQSPQAKL